MAAALLFDRISQPINHRNSLLLAALATLILVNAVKDREFYDLQSYRPETIITAWHAARSGAILPHIGFIGAFVDTNKQILLTNYRNDMIAMGVSQLACYNPTFGYRLEYFPAKSLHVGAVLAEKDGRLNIKNPACYLYPEQNNCAPGDHFTVAQRDAAQSFANYKPYPFSFSPTQKFANNVTYTALALLMALLAVALLKKFWRT